MIGLFAAGRRARLAAVRALEVASDDGAFVARRVLFTDHDAEVRAAAARRLAGAAHRDVEDWLLDAFGERSPLVREAVARALARRGTSRAAPALRRALADDRMWWVRRTAIYALASIAGAGELAALTAALADPFWRVRHAAVRVLAALGARDADVRAALRVEPATPTLAYLRAAWGPVAIEAPDRAALATSRLPAALLDPDPAVVTARLAASRELDPTALVELLCDPHAPLRGLAMERLAQRGPDGAVALDALDAALDWLEEPRIPHVADTVEHLLDGLGDPAAELAARALARAHRPGAARWAIGWVAATRDAALRDAALDRARADRSLRAAALRLADAAELVRWAADADADPDPARLVDAIASELHHRRSDALLALDARDRPRTRALQVDAAARLERWTAVEAALADPHHGPRAVATRWLVRARRIDGALQAADPDPAVREAALSPATAVPLVDDRDPWVRRAAIELLGSAWRGRDDVPDEVSRTAERALADPDPWQRAHACRVPLASDRALARALELLADRDDMVRAAALDALDALADAGDARLHALVADAAPLSPLATRMARAWLCRRLDDAALAALATLATSAAPAVPAAAAAGAAADAHAADAPFAALEVGAPAPAHAAPAMPAIERRAFGRAGFAVAPLAISGAFDLSPAALHDADDAGVDLWFWEPAYEGLTRFLRAPARRQRARVIAGSYHAEADAIAIDVDRALRKLRRDALDVFLLFWTRSPARVDRTAFEILDELKRAGKVRAIGFSTHDRALARAAIEAQPWDVVMTRHSAAHPGIEHELLPTARAHGTAIVTFSALCYGRMLVGDHAPPARDCYRYSLSQPGVVACISAPRRRAELVENLDALRAPMLDADRLAELRAHGLGVRADNQRFNTLLRQPTRDAAAAARELLDAELPPGDALEPRALPRPTTSRAARTSLGTSRRGRLR